MATEIFCTSMPRTRRPLPRWRTSSPFTSRLLRQTILKREVGIVGFAEAVDPVSDAMCNLYSITTNQAAIIALFRVLNRYVGNLPPMPGVFPDYPAPVVRNVGAERELLRVMSRPGVSSFVDRKRFSFGRLLLK